MSLIQGVVVSMSAMVTAWMYDYETMHCFLVGMYLAGAYIYCDGSEKEHIFQMDGFLGNEN